MQALGPVALVSLLLNDGLTRAIPGSDINENPNLPVDPDLQHQFNRAAVQVTHHTHVTISRMVLSDGDIPWHPEHRYFITGLTPRLHAGRSVV